MTTSIYVGPLTEDIFRHITDVKKLDYINKLFARDDHMVKSPLGNATASKTEQHQPVNLDFPLVGYVPVRNLPSRWLILSRDWLSERPIT